MYGYIHGNVFNDNFQETKISIDLIVALRITPYTLWLTWFMKTYFNINIAGTNVLNVIISFIKHSSQINPFQFKLWVHIMDQE